MELSKGKKIEHNCLGFALGTAHFKFHFTDKVNLIEECVNISFLPVVLDFRMS